jgi:hypothetical protein
MNKLTLGFVLLACATSCGKKKGGSAASSGPADVSAANAAIPAAWKGKLEFVSQTITAHDDAVTVPAPKGWKPGNIQSMLEPPDGSGFGFGTSFWPSKTCGGECKEKSAAEWEAAANSATFGNMLAHNPPPKVIKDEKTPGHRVLIAEDQYTGGQVNNITIMMGWWKDGADRMYLCTVDLAPESKDLVNAFEQACAHMQTDF